MSNIWRRTAGENIFIKILLQKLTRKKRIANLSRRL